MKYSVYTLLFKDRDLKEIPPILSELGYDGIEIRIHDDGIHLPIDPSSEKITEARKLAQDYGLEIPIISSYAKFGYPENRWKIEKEKMIKIASIADKLEAKYFRVQTAGYDDLLGYEKIRRFIRKQILELHSTLKEMNIEHPSAKMIVEIAKTQEKEIGDGTTTAVILAGELLKNAEHLLEQNIHPTILTKGYRLASKKAYEVLENMAIDVKNDNILKKIAMTAMTGKGTEYSKELLAELAVKAVKFVSEKTEKGIIIDKENIKLEKSVEKSVDESELIEGIVLDKERLNNSMPSFIKNAKIALIDSSIEVKTTEIDARIQITDPTQMQAYLDQEEQMLRKMINLIIKSGANVVICQKGIDDIAQHFLAKNNIFALRRVKKSDMDRLSKATGARIVSSLDDLSKEDIGKAGIVEQKKSGEEDLVYVRECKNPKAVTILIRGGTEHVVSEVKRALEDAIGDISSALISNKIVAGAGAPEMELNKELLSYANKLKGREQLAVSAFAQSMEVIPRTLAENAGLDPIDVLTSLKAAHNKGEKWAGIDVFSGKVIDAWKNGIIEPLKIKTQALSSAVEVAIMILRIDDVISSAPVELEQGQNPRQF